MEAFDKETFLAEAKKLKMSAVECFKEGDLPPVVFVEKGGKIKAMIVAPQVDKNLGLHAARLARIGFSADALSIIMDAHVATGPKVDTDDPAERLAAAKEFAKKYPQGSMQKACEEGACARGEITDVLLCHRVTAEGKYSMAFLPYEYHGKDGPPFQWLADHPATKEFDEIDGDHCSGYIPESLLAIMQEKAFMDNEEIKNDIQKMADICQITAEQQAYHTSRAMLKILKEQGFFVHDLQEPPEGYVPEPLNEPRNIHIGDLLPAKAINQVVSLLAEVGGFEQKHRVVLKNQIIEILKKYQDEIEANANKVKLSKKDVAPETLAEALILSRQNRLEQAKNTKKPPYKVKVYLRDGPRSFTRLGYYNKDVELYYAEMPDGEIQSVPEPEIPKLSPEQLSKEAKLRSSGFHPKLEMQNGISFYGPQVVWEEAEED